MGVHVSTQNSMHKGGIALENESLVSCKNGSSWQNVRVIERSRRKARKGHRELQTCFSRIFTLISQTRNGQVIPPTSGLKKDGCTWQLCLTCFRAWWEDGL